MNEIRHRWYKYKESFSPDLVNLAITECEIKKSSLIIDPFNGSGTVTLTASNIGVNSIGIEVNPFAAFLANTKNQSPKTSDFKKIRKAVLAGVNKGSLSPLLNFSTFSEKGNKEKWLFNSSILNSFEGGWKKTLDFSNSLSSLAQLALIGAAIDNCNAVKDGKCLKYRPNWESTKYNKTDFIACLENRLSIIEEDIEENVIKTKSKILKGDSRAVLNNIKDKFSLCITSPPYLNSFDYTDLYRPELFLGKFITDNSQLQKLRAKTIRSHVEIKLSQPIKNDFGLLYSEAISQIKANAHLLWDKQIPVMVQAYFEDMYDVMKLLKSKAAANANLWIVVSNSAYAGIEIPVDLIIGEIGTKTGWYLKEIEVLQYLKKRISKSSPNITELRESIIKFSTTH